MVVRQDLQKVLLELTQEPGKRSPAHVAQHPAGSPVTLVGASTVHDLRAPQPPICLPEVVQRAAALSIKHVASSYMRAFETPLSEEQITTSMRFAHGRLQLPSGHVCRCRTRWQTRVGGRCGDALRRQGQRVA